MSEHAHVPRSTSRRCSACSPSARRSCSPRAARPGWLAPRRGDAPALRLRAFAWLSSSSPSTSFSSAPSRASATPASAAPTGRAATATPARSARSGAHRRRRGRACRPAPVTAPRPGSRCCIATRRRRSARSSSSSPPWRCARRARRGGRIGAVAGRLDAGLDLRAGRVRRAHRDAGASIRRSSRLHLLGGIGLLALLADPGRALCAAAAARAGRRCAPALVAVAVLAVVQIALGGWVSTNYAVLACTDFPTCQGSWWPEMDCRRRLRRAARARRGTATAATCRSRR